jgi:radical SAM protein with 4Fe4S-binding SPASM domain
MTKLIYPTDAVIAVTYRCDSKCEMCNIWKLDPQELLSVDDYAKIPSSLKDINISGGEPFLRKDIIDLVCTVHDKCRGPRIVISSNGFRTERIIEAMEILRQRIPSIGIGISIDGIGEKHDRIRGVEDAYQRAIYTLMQLQKRRFSNVRIGFTAMRDNVNEMKAVYDLSCLMGFQFTTSVAQNSEIYFSTDENQAVPDEPLQEALGYVMEKELASPHPKRWMRAYFESGSLLFNQEQRRLLPCKAGLEFFYLAPEGLVYPCLTIPEQMGDLKEQTFKEIWESDRARAVRNQIDGCQQCWMICTARGALRRNILGVLGWIAREKVKIHLK